MSEYGAYEIKFLCFTFFLPSSNFHLTYHEVDFLEYWVSEM